MNNPLYLFVGKSSSGKTTVANMLEEQYGYKQVFSYTTREPRYEGEIGHIFITKDEFNNLGKLAAHTVYNEHYYGTTFEQLNECNIYVIDPYGAESLLEKCDNYHRAIRIIYFDVPIYNRIQRMLNRGDSDMQIVSRLLNDENEDWYKMLDGLTFDFADIGIDVELYKVDASATLSEVVDKIVCYMKKCEEE